MLTHRGDDLLFFFVSNDRLEIFGFGNEAAVETLHIIDAVATRNDHGTVMLTNTLRGFHKCELGFILAM